MNGNQKCSEIQISSIICQCTLVSSMAVHHSSGGKETYVVVP